MFSLPTFLNSIGRLAIGGLICTIFTLLTACSFPDAAESLETIDSQAELRSNNGNQIQAEEDISIIAGLTVDADGNTVVPFAADPATLLYYRRTGLPVLAPDGHHLTAGEFAAAKGTASAKCIKSGTQVSIHLSGLIPHATYRFWVLTFKAPGFNLMFPNPFVNLIGEGTIGPQDRSRNTIKASASGQASIVRFIPEGAFSEFGNAGNCLITDAFEWHVFGAFQQPGQPAGEDVGPPVFFPFSAVEQLVFVFK